MHADRTSHTAACFASASSSADWRVARMALAQSVATRVVAGRGHPQLESDAAAGEEDAEEDVEAAAAAAAASASLSLSLPEKEETARARRRARLMERTAFRSPSANARAASSSRALRPSFTSSGRTCCCWVVFVVGCGAVGSTSVRADVHGDVPGLVRVVELAGAHPARHHA